MPEPDVALCQLTLALIAGGALGGDALGCFALARRVREHLRAEGFMVTDRHV